MLKTNGKSNKETKIKVNNRSQVNENVLYCLLVFLI